MTSERWTIVRGETRTIHDVLRALPSIKSGLTFEIVSISRAPSFRGSDISSEAQIYTARAREEHHDFGFGYWEFLLSAVKSAPSEIRKPIIKRAGFHTGGESWLVNESELVSMVNSGELTNLPDRTMLSLSSRVRTDRTAEEYHFPMLDFAMKSDVEGDGIAIEVLQALGLSGYLLDSGRSYHFIGTDLINPTDMRVMLARAQLLSPYVDSRWISHSQIEGRCALRITSDSDRNATLPSIVASSVGAV